MYRWNIKQMTGKRVYDLWSEIATQFTCAEGMVELNHRRGLSVTEPWLIFLENAYLL
jgi:hypothetical protein